VVETLETTPKDATHWSTRSKAQRHGISRQTVSEVWRAFGLKPCRQDEFKISPDPDLIEKIRDLVGLYLSHRLRPAGRARGAENLRVVTPPSEFAIGGTGGCPAPATESAEMAQTQR